MPDDPGGPGTVEKRIEGVPLYLVPKVIADHIREMREQVFRISVCRGKEHRYQIVVETFADHTQRNFSAPPPETKQGRSVGRRKGRPSNG
jgi:hypothetical protein